MITDVELGWLAGLLEGEGSFMMGRNHVGGKVYYYPRIVVTMTDEDVVQRAAKLFNTSIYKVPKDSKRPETYLQQYRAQINGARAAQLMTDLLPHMGSRRKSKIEEVLLSYGEIESTEIRRSRSCSESQKLRWAKYGTKEGKL